MNSPMMSYDFPLFIDKSAWKVKSVDSYQGGNEAKLAIDGNNSTFWHTAWGTNEPRHPHTVTAITYLSRQDGNQNGMVKEYEVYLSTDGQTWGAKVASGSFQNTTALQTAKLNTATTARYMKFVAKSEINGNAWTSAAEIGIEAEDEATAINMMQNKKESMKYVYDLHIVMMVRRPHFLTVSILLKDVKS